MVSRESRVAGGGVAFALVAGIALVAAGYGDTLLVALIPPVFGITVPQLYLSLRNEGTLSEMYLRGALVLGGLYTLQMVSVVEPASRFIGPGTDARPAVIAAGVLVFACWFVYEAANGYRLGIPDRSN